ncbi:hypothetical protein [Roseibium aggregatum]|uniref:Uncharacterized protein n=1 Tax=Roseibium aggregatum TaxID=187304 RepID=A0A926S752_9HYPH|nr:hypothetical protein [Roseibium aggregatum]MBD1549263.1 hypothetical protein [Roseibium aggregatum]
MPFSTENKQPQAVFAPASRISNGWLTARMRIKTICVAIALMLTASPAFAKSTGWQSMKEFRKSVEKLISTGYAPTRFSVRMKGSKPEFNAVFSNKSFFSYSFTVHDSRDSAEAEIELHRDPGPGMIDKLCLANFARAQGAGKEYWIIYLVDPKQSGYRCKKMPSS